MEDEPDDAPKVQILRSLPAPPPLPLILELLEPFSFSEPVFLAPGWKRMGLPSGLMTLDKKLLSLVPLLCCAAAVRAFKEGVVVKPTNTDTADCTGLVLLLLVVVLLLLVVVSVMLLVVV